MPHRARCEAWRPSPRRLWWRSPARTISEHPRSAARDTVPGCRPSPRPTAAAPARRSCACTAITDTWRTWELVLPALERQHDVLAPTLAGHAGGPPIDGESDERDARRRGRAGDGRGRLRDGAHRRQLARRLRRRCSSPRAGARAAWWRWRRRRLGAGGPVLRRDARATSPTTRSSQGGAPHADAIVATAEGAGGRPSTPPPTTSTSRPSCSPTRSVGAAGCEGLRALVDARRPRRLAARRRADRRAPCGSCGAAATRSCTGRSAAVRFREEWLPHADWVELEGIGHCPQLDVPLDTSQLILGFTGG